jgi:hypothetical protein
MKPSFRILVLFDTDLWLDFGADEFDKWAKHGFVFRGVRAGHHLFQAAIFHILNFWEPQWTTCLDELDKSVSIRVTL